MEPLIKYENQINESVYAPKDGQFWAPFIEYDSADFEEELSEQYRVLYPSELEMDTESTASDEFEEESMVSIMEREDVVQRLKFKGRALSIICSLLVVVVFFVFTLRNDIAFPEFLPEDGKIFNYASR